jgi:pimeloyl-ACP methyl ester carboxylesterase
MTKTIAILAAVAVLCTAGYVALARIGAFQISRDELIKKYADKDSKFVEVKGTTFHYKDQGTGPAVLLLHGSFGSNRTWDVVVEEMGSGYRLIRFDQPPSGLSSDIPFENEGLSLEDFLAAFLDEIGVDEVSLVGTSSGGIFGYRFAAEYPDRAKALIIANAPSAVVDNNATDTPFGLGVLIYISRNILHYQPRLYWRWLLESLYAEPSRLKNEVVEQYYDIARRTQTAPYVRSLFARVNDTTEIDGILARITTPTLLLWGAPDRVLPEEMGYQLQRKLTAIEPELIFLEGTGHYPPVESPEIVADHIKRFLSKTLN